MGAGREAEDEREGRHAPGRADGHPAGGDRPIGRPSHEAGRSAARGSGWRCSNSRRPATCRRAARRGDRPAGDPRPPSIQAAGGAVASTIDRDPGAGRAANSSASMAARPRGIASGSGGLCVSGAATATAAEVNVGGVMQTPFPSGRPRSAGRATADSPPPTIQSASRRSEDPPSRAAHDR